ncbi:translation elongation factor Ts [Haliovirga abyssi]|uniref:Elongation factor Ts n=1 Tax=Haliovirga abyssi TaxID=2996794 RepID=A0AAU9DUK9_9FUSO|nr:translation elongation factor Ts [Haliovirga abyssi]BDU49666.1 elongation factor Ts [Haliovirga abyssi]
MKVTAAMVKNLREKTGAGMLDCKKALVETEGDVEKAIDFLRKKGIAKAVKKSGRVAAEGIVVSAVSEDLKSGVILEFNSETDFVAKNDEFKGLANDIANIVLVNDFSNVEELKAADLNGKTVEVRVHELIAKIGENMNIRRFKKVVSTEGFVSTYIHLGGKIGVILNLKGEATEEAKVASKDVAMHIAAMSPRFLAQTEVTEEVLDREKDIARVQLEKEGKPANIIEKILIGKMRKFYEENCLLNQKFVKDPDTTIEKYIKGKFEIVSFDRFLLGEGIEKEEVDFAEEVKRQVEGK